MIHRFVVCCVVAAALALTSWSALEAAAAAPAQQKSDLVIHTEPSHAMTPAGGSAEVLVSLHNAAGQPQSGGLEARMDARTVADAESFDLKISVDRPSKYSVKTDGLEPGIHTVEFRHLPSKTTHKFYVDVVDRLTWEAFDQAAKQIEFKTLPVHLLFLGDSLTDLFRGQNYVDKIAFWLGRRLGSQATVRNAGVGGDYILRVWDRLNADPKSYRLEMYGDLYQPRPTHVFFFLGHNDSKLSSTSGYTRPVVEPSQYLETYRRAIRKVQQETGARIAVISATSSVYEITQATAEKSRTRGKPHNLFGKPEALEQFNALARQAAGECGADWIDVYEPTRLHRDKPSLFTADGVHVSNLGNRLLALKILEYLGQDQ